MKKSLALALTLVVVGAALAGCGKTSTPTSSDTLGSNGTATPTAVDIAQVNDQVANNPALVDESLSADPSPFVLDPATSTLGIGRRHPLRWWRTIDSTTRNVSFTYGDPDSLGRPTTAIATVHRRLLGQFHVVFFDTSTTDTTRRVIVKPLDDSWTRRLALRRVRTDSAGIVTKWRIVGTSGVLMTSNGATTHIVSVRVQAAGKDTTLTDPLQLHRLPRLLCLHGFVPVHLTVTTGRNDDLVYLYRFGDRRAFVANGDGTYSIDFVAWDFGGLQHFGVNAFSRGTIVSETDPYDSEAWVLPNVARDFDAAIEHERHDD